MRHAVLIAVSFVFCAIPVEAGYLIENDDFVESLSLRDQETLLMTGGGIDHLMMFDSSSADVYSTNPLLEGDGGIWFLTLAGYSQLEFSGGGIHEFVIGSYAQALLSGGRIDEIRSYQSAWQYGGDPPALLPDPHITIVCDLDSVNHNIETNVLTGNWLAGTGFEIQLIDVDGYSPAIENIQFVPEPATLLLVGAGGLLLRRKRN